MKRNLMKIARPADALLPAALLIASLLGRATVALWLFIAYMTVKLCALATSDALRRTFAGQPSMRKVQGSATLTIALQFPGALIAALIVRFTHQGAALYPLVACGLLLNIEQVFYEYLCATGDGQSSTFYRVLTALLTLMGLLLCAPRSRALTLPNIDAALLVVPIAISAAIGLAVSLLLGGKLQPRLNGEVFRHFPLSMLQSALYPAAALALLRLLAPGFSPALPLFSGLILYSLCRSPFRRTPAESRPMNQALLVACLVASALALIYYFFLKKLVSPILLLVCLAILLAALCAFALFGNIRYGRRDEA